MVAQPSSPIVAADAPCGPSPIVECPDQCLALLQALADGRQHRFDALASLFADPNDRGDPTSIARVTDAIEAFRSSGMRLVHDHESVRAHPFTPLANAALEKSAAGWDVRLVGSTASTNTDLSRTVRGATGFVGPRLVATEFQSAGRGRLGRRWSSTPGASLTASFALRVERSLARIDGATLVCGLAVRDVIAASGVPASLKWPNDILVDDCKLGGILVEAHDAGSATILVVGVGLNVGAREPIEVDQAALPDTDLERCGGRMLDRNQLIGQVGGALRARLAVFATSGFAPFIDEWNGVDALRDRAVLLQPALHAASDSPPRSRSGVARGVDLGGALCVDVDGVRTRVVSGDISVRPAGR